MHKNKCYFHIVGFEGTEHKKLKRDAQEEHKKPVFKFCFIETFAKLNLHVLYTLHSIASNHHTSRWPKVGHFRFFCYTFHLQSFSFFSNHKNLHITIEDTITKIVFNTHVISTKANVTTPRPQCMCHML